MIDKWVPRFLSFIFEIGAHVTHNSFRFAMYLRLGLNSQVLGSQMPISMPVQVCLSLSAFVLALGIKFRSSGTLAALHPEPQCISTVNSCLECSLSSHTSSQFLLPLGSRVMALALSTLELGLQSRT